jgi:LacI family transcriptional regulator
MSIKNIANLAGAYVSTVSRVINNHLDVKDDIRNKVLEVRDEVNYRTNNSVRILKLKFLIGKRGRLLCKLLK